jgi:hypothetical protein
VTHDLDHQRARLVAAAERIRRTAPGVADGARTSPDPETGKLPLGRCLARCLARCLGAVPGRGAVRRGCGHGRTGRTKAL